MASLEEIKQRIAEQLEAKGDTENAETVRQAEQLELSAEGRSMTISD